MTVWIYTDLRKQVGDKDHLKVFGFGRSGRDLTPPEEVEAG
ncbi:hypothetical protein ABID58_007591 [Bradyrhizobium sp. S3.2.6]|jgi:hypothetical protein